MIQAIVSGFQTGADIGCILAAKELDLGMGGYMPKGWRTEAGPRPEYEELYGAIECWDDDYLTRTRLNVEASDGTVIFGRRSPGSNKTEELCRVTGKPCCWVVWTPSFGDANIIANTSMAGTLMIGDKNYAAFKLWIARNNIKILNGAGNRESKNPGIGEFTKSFLIRTLGGK